MEVTGCSEKTEMGSNNYSNTAVAPPDEIEQLTTQDIHNVISVPVVDQFCRVCGAQRGPDDLVSIFGERGSQLDLHRKIVNRLHLQVERDDLLPQQVCTACVCHLSICQELFETSHAADTKLRQLFLLPPMAENEEVCLEVPDNAMPELDVLQKSQENDAKDAIRESKISILDTRPLEESAPDLTETTPQDPGVHTSDQARSTPGSRNQQQAAEKRPTSETVRTGDQVLLENVKQQTQKTLSQTEVVSMSGGGSSQVLPEGSHISPKIVSYGVSWQNGGLARYDHSKWADVEEVRVMLRKLRHTVFEVAESRYRALNLLDTLPTTKVVGPRQRFPDNGTYINTDNTDFVSIIDKICATLLKHKDLVCRHCSPEEEDDYCSRLFLKNLKRLESHVESHEWARKGFEARYKLTWAPDSQREKVYMPWL